ncbi:MAG: zinc carboxypeptidase, partial [Pseudonocardiaceae bacterium]
MIAVLGLLALAVPLSATAAPPPPPEPVSAYRVQGMDSPAARTAVLRQGVDVLGGGRDYLEVRASPAQAERLRAGGLRLLPLPALVPVPGVVAPGAFPIGYGGYHTYDKLTAELN